ncbi:hypothetical protein CSA37_08845 [Candidatus Fermentibacteria bacterium]|nr:MAG: hypothetical protein CSA37_08845 [Candidatus Fermentibacteria bacterium]
MNILPFKFTLKFIELFMTGLLLVSPILLFLIGILLIIAKLTCRTEKWKSYSKSVYFILITALTVGYGQTVPKTGKGRFLAILSGFVGVVLTGLVVSVAINSVMISWQATHDTSVEMLIESKLETMESNTFHQSH